MNNLIFLYLLASTLVLKTSHSSEQGSGKKQIIGSPEANTSNPLEDFKNAYSENGTKEELASSQLNLSDTIAVTPTPTTELPLTGSVSKPTDMTTPSPGKNHVLEDSQSEGEESVESKDEKEQAKPKIQTPYVLQNAPESGNDSLEDLSESSTLETEIEMVSNGGETKEASGAVSTTELDSSESSSEESEVVSGSKESPPSQVTELHAEPRPHEANNTKPNSDLANEEIIVTSNISNSSSSHTHEDIVHTLENLGSSPEIAIPKSQENHPVTIKPNLVNSTNVSSDSAQGSSSPVLSNQRMNKTSSIEKPIRQLLPQTTSNQNNWLQPTSTQAISSEESIEVTNSAPYVPSPIDSATNASTDIQDLSTVITSDSTTDNTSSFESTSSSPVDASTIQNDHYTVENVTEKSENLNPTVHVASSDESTSDKNDITSTVPSILSSKEVNTSRSNVTQKPNEKQPTGSTEETTTPKSDVHQFLDDLKVHMLMSLVAVLVLLVAFSLVFSFLLVLILIIKYVGIGLYKIFKKLSRCLKKRKGSNSSSTENVLHSSGSLFPRCDVTVRPYEDRDRVMF